MKALIKIIRVSLLISLLSFKLVVSFGQSNIDSLKNSDIIDPIEIMPEFPGGECQFYCFIDRNLDKKIIKSLDTVESVVVQFTIDTIGQVTNVKLMKPLRPVIDNELLRIIKMMPKWKPGIQNNKVVPVVMNFPLSIPYKNRFCH